MHYLNIQTILIAPPCSEIYDATNLIISPFYEGIVDNLGECAWQLLARRLGQRAFSVNMVKLDDLVLITVVLILVSRTL